MNKKCEEIQKEIPLYFSNGLKSEEMKIVDSHIESCAKCKKVFETYRIIENSLNEREIIQPSGSLFHLIMKRYYIPIESVDYSIRLMPIYFFISWGVVILFLRGLYIQHFSLAVFISQFTQTIIKFFTPFYIQYIFILYAFILVGICMWYIMQKWRLE